MLKGARRAPQSVDSTILIGRTQKRFGQPALVPPAAIDHRHPRQRRYFLLRTNTHPGRRSGHRREVGSATDVWRCARGFSIHAGGGVSHFGWDAHGACPALCSGSKASPMWLPSPSTGHENQRAQRHTSASALRRCLAPLHMEALSYQRRILAGESRTRLPDQVSTEQPWLCPCLLDESKKWAQVGIRSSG